MQNACTGFKKGGRVDSVFFKGQKLISRSRRFIYFFDDIVRGAFYSVNSVLPEQHYHEPVKILGARSDNDLSSIHIYAAVSRQIAFNGLFKNCAACVWRFFQDNVVIIGKHPPHGLA